MTKILSEPSLHVEQDSSINLTCIASSVLQHGGKGSQYSDNNRIQWYKNDKVNKSEVPSRTGLVDDSLAVDSGEKGLYSF